MNNQNTYYHGNLNNRHETEKKERDQNNYSVYNPQASMPNNFKKYVDSNNITSSPNKEKIKYTKIIVLCILFASAITVGLFFVTQNVYDSYKKNRTIMIYMVGSDLESKSKQGTFSLEEIDGSNIDLDNNNILLMVGGSKKWHNFVNPEEVAIYQLYSNGFNKVETEELLNMGSGETLSYFLDYSYNNYPAKNYDLIFWNHGLGSIGIEHDEVSNDFINISELDNAFKVSKFNNRKLELAIFYNCLSENLQMAKVMSKYANYMLGSEEIIYLSKTFDRFTFLEDIKKNDSVQDIANYFIEKSDSVIDNYNEIHVNKINSTLSLIDLSKIEELDNKLNKFIDTIDISGYYYSIANTRRNLYTYGKRQNNNYDTVDLYSLVEALGPYSSNSRLKDELQESISAAILINSSFDNYSYGIATYFPYYSSNKTIESHLTLFEKMWDTSYVKFIRSFHDIKYSNYKNNRASTGKNINYLTNYINVNNNSVEIELTNEESGNYQYANVYIFNKTEDNLYELLLQSNNVVKDNNKLKFNYEGLLKVNNTLITYLDLEYKNIYGTLSNENDSSDIIMNLNNDNGKFIIDETILDSGDNPLSGIVDVSDYDKLTLSKKVYNIFDNDDIQEDWKNNFTKENIEVSSNPSFSISKESLKDKYILIEMYDVNNDSFYSKLFYVK